MRWRASGLPALMTVLRNEGRWDASNAIYADGRVLAYDKRAPGAEMQWIDYGLGGTRAQRARSRCPGGSERPLGPLPRLAHAGLLCGYAATERFYEIGTPRGAGRNRCPSTG